MKQSVSNKDSFSVLSAERSVIRVRTFTGKEITTEEAASNELAIAKNSLWKEKLTGLILINR